MVMRFKTASNGSPTQILGSTELRKHNLVRYRSCNEELMKYNIPIQILVATVNRLQEKSLSFRIEIINIPYQAEI
jgi:hypothetical protein